MEDDLDPFFGAESKYAALTALVAFLRDEDWRRLVDVELAQAAELEEEAGRMEEADGEYAHSLFGRFKAYQALVEARISRFLEDYHCGEEGRLTKETLFEQLAEASLSSDRYSADEVQALITRCTDFDHFLTAVRRFSHEKREARQAVADMGL